MDTRGNIREIGTEDNPQPNEILIDKKPNPKCKDCYGRGYQRWIIENITETKPCHCVRKKATEQA